MSVKFFIFLIVCFLLCSNFIAFSEDSKGEFFYSDPYIMYSVRKALYEDMVTGRFELPVTSEAGTVTISGEADCEETSETAEAITGNVAGVKKVNNNIIINPSLKTRPFLRTDKEINDEIAKKLSTVKRVKVYKLDTVTIGGRVTIKGRVDSLDAEIASLETARSVEGVTSVRSKMEVDSGVNDGYTFVATKLLMVADPRINGFGIHIDVEDGIIILRGNVDNEDTRQIAINKARGIAGSKGVISYLEINETVTLDKPAVSDTTLTAQVEELLKGDKDLSRYNIKPSCTNGIVTLSGTVDSRDIILSAVEKVSTIPGVRAVKSELEIKS
ncbi:MAG: BON domain-containing protein [Candidatus Eremiobacterota bacterium]